MGATRPAAAAAGAGAVDDGGMKWPSDSRLFWGIYGLAWIPYAAGYLVLSVTSDCTGVGQAASMGGMFTVPAAVVGVGAVRMTRRWDWPPEDPVRFALVHLLGAVLFTVVWLTGVDLLMALRRVVKGGSFRLAGLNSGLLRWHFVAGLLLYGAIVTVTYLARTGRRLQRERERAARTEALRVKAEIEAIESRLNPHFLFNALHSCLSLIRRAPGRAETAVERLGDLLRYAVGAGEELGREEVSLQREVEMVRTYLDLEKLRLGDRLTVREDVEEEALDVRLAPLTIQPLVENAVQHGISEVRDGGTIHLEAELRDDDGSTYLIITVRDDGSGADTAAVQSPEGTGLDLVRDRLALLYGKEGALEIDTSPGEGFEARVRIPIEDGAGERDPAARGR